MPADGREAAYPFFSSMVSQDWQALGFPNLRSARFWDTRSCGVACLRMVYARLLPWREMLPATITENMLRNGSYSEQSGWNHNGLVRHAQSQGLNAERVDFSTLDAFLETARKPGALVVSVGPSFQTQGTTGHLVLVTGVDDAGRICIHRPSSQHPEEGKDMRVEPHTFWEHFSGRGVYFSKE